MCEVMEGGVPVEENVTMFEKVPVAIGTKLLCKWEIVGYVVDVVLLVQRNA